MQARLSLIVTNETLSEFPGHRVVDVLTDDMQPLASIVQTVLSNEAAGLHESISSLTSAQEKNINEQLSLEASIKELDIKILVKLQEYL